MGFGAAGPIAGTLAAGWQAMMGAAVPAGGLFAILQGAAMGGAAAPAVGTVLAGMGAGVGGAAGAVANRARRGRDDDDD